MGSISLIAVAVLCLGTIQLASGYLYPTYGAIGGLTDTCLTDLNNIFNGQYLLTSTGESQDTRKEAWFLNPQRRLGCRLLILQAMETFVNDQCPAEEDIINCFWVAHDDWVNLVNKCEVFKSQVPLPACSDSPGEAAEGVPSCSATDSPSTSSNGQDIQGRRRLLQGPANNQGIATWTYSNGESIGLQYDPFALPGTPAASPPLAANAAGVTGSDAAALRTANEGNEGAAISGSGTSSLMDVGCFPSFWDGKDFSNWLSGDYVERARPKDIGGLNAVGLVSVLIYTLLLSSLAFL